MKKCLSSLTALLLSVLLCSSILYADELPAVSEEFYEMEDFHDENDSEEIFDGEDLSGLPDEQEQTDEEWVAVPDSSNTWDVLEPDDEVFETEFQEFDENDDLENLEWIIPPAAGFVEIEEPQEELVGAGGVYNKLMSLQSKFPDGKFWNHIVPASQAWQNCYDESFADSCTWTPCASHGNVVDAGQYDCNYFDGGWQCCGFARKVFYDVFGERESSDSLIRHYGSSGLSVGDYVHFNWEHYAVVLSISGSQFTVVEANLDGSGAAYNCKIRWNHTYNLSQIDYYVHSNNYIVIDGGDPVPVNPSWTNETDSITDTNAVLRATVNMPGQGNFSLAGVVLWDANGNQLAQKTENVSYNTSYMKQWYDVQSELGVRLSPNSKYRYQFTAVFNGATYKSDVWELTTTGSISATWTKETDGITESNAVLRATITMPAQGTYTLAGVTLWSADGVQLAQKTENVSYNTSYMKQWYDVQSELGVTLSPESTYRYQFTAIYNGTTYKSDVWELTTSPSAVIPATVTWSNSKCLPSRRSAYISVEMNASGTGSFSYLYLKIWDTDGNLIASKEEPASKNNGKLTAYYEIYSETRTPLQEGTTYEYQISAVLNGTLYESPRYNLTTETKGSRHFGIDVSSHQKRIDWDTVSEYIDFAILRCGFAGNTTDQDDAEWLNNVSACERLGIPYGVYFYSYAENDQEALGEAEHALRLLSGHKPALPVYYDLEDEGTVGKLSNEQICSMLDVFARKITAAGYKVGVYATVNWWDTRLNNAGVEGPCRWAAGWDPKYTYLTDSCALWQFSDKGVIPGIEVEVDLDYSKNFSFGSIYEPSDLHTHSVRKVPGTEASCTENGSIEHWICDSCGKYFADETCSRELTEADITIPARGHTVVTDPEIPAKCEIDGLTEGSHCSVCNSIIVKQETVKATGHKWGEWIVMKDATETEDGLKIRICGNDSTHIENVTIPKTGGHTHTPIVEDDKAASCTEAGYTGATVCSECGETLKERQIVPATGHDWGNWQILQEATDTTSGLKVRICKHNPDHIEKEVIPAGNQEEDPQEEDPQDKRIDVSKLEVRYYLVRAIYTGKALRPLFVKFGDTILTEGTDYTITYSDNINAGKGKATIIGIGNYKGSRSVTFPITQASNRIKVTPLTATVKYAKLKSKAQTVTIKATAAGEKAKTTCKLISVPQKAKKYISMSAAGKITIKKGLAKGTYNLKIRVTSQATANYAAAAVEKTVKIVVK